MAVQSSAVAMTATRKPTAAAVSKRRVAGRKYLHCGEPGGCPDHSPGGSDPKAAQPFVKWAGGKRQLLLEIRKHVPEKFGCYFEPLVGGAAVFFDLRARGFTGGAYLGDSNTELMNCYEQVAHHVDAVIQHLRLLKYDEKVYYATRAKNPASMTPAARAARTLYLNKAGFNGLYRVNKKGGFNVPFGKYTNPTICDELNLRACARALANTVSYTELITGDFTKVVEAAKRGDFVYFDPPYVPVGGYADFTTYTKEGFGPDDQQRLVMCVAKLKARGVRVLLSNHDLPLVRKLYKGFQLRTVKAKRNINSCVEKRGHVDELLIW
jgi:DNA adenine methylase